MSDKWTLDQMGSQAGKRFLITGANSGVGYSAAVELARRGAVVVMGCRDRARGEAAQGRLKAETGGSAELVVLDLASLDSVRCVAEAEVARGLALDGLINNAGVMAPPKRLETEDGFELQFGTNVLGHYVLTCMLTEALARAKAGRVVTLASIAHKRGRIAFEDLQSERRYKPMDAYGQSKLADLMLAIELERRYREAGLPMVSIAVHPGVARTNLFKVGSSTGLARVAERVIQGSIGLFLGSELDGAIPTLYAATSPDAVGGAYYGPQGLQEMRGGNVGLAAVSVAAQDEVARRRLWDVCAELTGVNLPV